MSIVHLVGVVDWVGMGPRPIYFNHMEIDATMLQMEASICCNQVKVICGALVRRCYRDALKGGHQVV